MRQVLTSITTALLIVTSGFAFAQTPANTLTFTDPWIRGSVPGQTNGAGYLEISNASKQPVSLTAVKSDRTDRVELHTIVREGNVAKMREVQEIVVPANGSVTLKPGGYHIMFVGLKQPFKDGETISVTMDFTDGGSATVPFKVMPPTFTGGGHQMPHHMMKGH